MIISVLSPAKSLDFESEAPYKDTTEPRFLDQSEKIAKKLKSLSRKKIADLMSISTQLAELNYGRNQEWDFDHTTNSKQSLFAFDGDVYSGLEAETLKKNEVEFAQNHVRILSGLYGLLRPLDLIHPYRLEMGTKLPIGKKKNLYEFWGDQISNLLNSDFGDSSEKVVLNLASNEYFKSVQVKKLEATVLDVDFKDFKNGQYKVISFFAKKARGAMARFQIENQIENSEDLKGFNWEGYTYNDNQSESNKWVFTRESN